MSDQAASGKRRDMCREGFCGGYLYICTLEKGHTGAHQHWNGNKELPEIADLRARLERVKDAIKYGQELRNELKDGAVDAFWIAVEVELEVALRTQPEGESQ